MPQKIMIVEDNELNLKLFTDLLRAHKFNVEGIKDGRLALEQAKMFQPDLIIMDIQLPHVSGLDLIAAMQKDNVLKPIPILAVTAYAAKGDEEKIMEIALEAGAEDIATNDDGSTDVATSAEDFIKIRDAMIATGLTPAHAEVIMLAANDVPLAKDHAEQMVRLTEMLEDLDDVQSVYSNADYPEEVLS